MTLLWIIGGLLSLLAVLLVVRPLLRRQADVAPAKAYDAAIVADQLQEVDRDQADGLIDAEAAAAARRELKRRLLLALERAQSPAAARPGTAEGQPNKPRPALAIGVALAVPLIAALVYLQQGNPSIPDAPLFARRAAGDLAAANDRSAVDPGLVETVAQLERYLASHPDEGRGWLLLGRSYLTLDRAEEAISALAKAKALLPDQPEVAAAYGEALVIADDGKVSDEALSVFSQVMTADPRNIQARFYLALARAQAGDIEGAMQDWVDVVALSPREAPWLPVVRQQIAAAAQAIGADPAKLKPSAAAIALVPPNATPTLDAEPPTAPGPNAEDMKAAAEMSPEQREAMIRSMVARLAARLEQQPDDRQGWLRLARAYEVLGETAKAADAHARAEAATK